ncbi:hypothetical protein [Legionella bononiensis]|uniref:hypothetical protein n=1 Tax=Legionella bononiensis TaxID=2793102 RepID=UPI00272B860F|nr:hypothetical protein [Legionella bononiensis]
MSKKAYIIGMGPAGLASALSLLSRGYSVALIDKRTEEEIFCRRQGVFLTEETISEFFALTRLGTKGYSLAFEDNFSCQLIRPNDAASLEMNAEDLLDLSFFELIEKEHTVIPIGELQLYQYNKLKCIYTRGNYTFHEQEEAYTVTFDLEKQQLSFHMGDVDILKVDAEKQELTLNIKGALETHGFKLLIDASGKTSKSFTQLWNRQNPKFAIQYYQLENPEHNAFGVMYLSIENAPKTMHDSTVLSPLEKSRFISLEHLDMLTSLGWKYDRAPLIFLKYSREYNTVYVTGEIPERILERYNEEELKGWFDLVMQLLFDDRNFKTHIIESPSAFSMNIEIESNYSIRLPSGGTYCLVGDALMPANFLLGCGIKNALNDAEELYSMIENRFAESESYRASRRNKYQKLWSIFKEIIPCKFEMLELMHRVREEKDLMDQLLNELHHIRAWQHPQEQDLKRSENKLLSSMTMFETPASSSMLAESSAPKSSSDFMYKSNCP